MTRMIGNFAGVYGMEWVGRKVVADLRQALFNRYVSLPATFYDRFSTGQLISKLAYNSEQVANAATTSVVSAFRDVLLVIMLLAVMITSNLRLTLVMLVLVPMIGLLVTFISRRFRKISHRIQDSMGNVSHVTEEAVAGHRVVKVFRSGNRDQAASKTVNEKPGACICACRQPNWPAHRWCKSPRQCHRFADGDCHATRLAERYFRRYVHDDFLGHGRHHPPAQTPHHRTV